jgi:TusA-related sulfurtransferase
MEQTNRATHTMDVRGTICPFPDVNTMSALRNMEKGEVLEVYVDNPLSIERIPRNAIRASHKVLDIIKLNGPNYCIRIQVLGLK